MFFSNEKQINILMLNAYNNSEIFEIMNKGLLKPYDFYGVKISLQFPLSLTIPIVSYSAYSGQQ